MTQAAQGQILSLKEALSSLEDKNGDPIKWEEQKDGSYTFKLEGKPGSYNYYYSLTPNPVFVKVAVIKEDIPTEEEEKEKKAKAEAEAKPEPTLKVEQQTTKHEKQQEREVKTQKEIERNISPRRRYS